MKVFISHSTEDRGKFDDLACTLEQGDIKYWNPKQMPAGASLRERLRMAIKECSVCVFIVTQRSLNSRWCQAEIGAFWGAGKPVVLYLSDDSLPEDSLPKQFIGDIYARGIREVLDSVKTYFDEAGRAAQNDERSGYVQLSLDSYTILVGPPMKLEGIDISEVTWDREQCFLVGPSFRENVLLEPSRVGNSYIIRLQNPILNRILQSKVQLSLDLKDTEGNHWKTAPISLLENFVYLKLSRNQKCT
jgi:hypothetical protein